MLKGWNGGSLAQIFSLPRLSLESLKESLKNQRGGSERALLEFSFSFVRKEAREREGWRVREGYIYPSHSKLAIVQQLPGEFGCISGYSGPGARTFRAETRTLRVQQQAHSKLFLVIFLNGFCGSLGLYVFLEH